MHGWGLIGYSIITVFTLSTFSQRVSNGMVGILTGFSEEIFFGQSPFLDPRENQTKIKQKAQNKTRERLHLTITKAKTLFITSWHLQVI